MFSGESTKSTHPLAIALSGMSGWAAVSSFCAMVVPPHLLDAAQRDCPIAIIAGDHDGDKLVVPVLGQGTQKDRNHVGPSSRLGYRPQTELTSKNMQTTQCRDDEHMIGLDDQPFRNQFSRHRCVLL